MLGNGVGNSSLVTTDESAVARLSKQRVLTMFGQRKVATQLQWQGREESEQIGTRILRFANDPDFVSVCVFSVVGLLVSLCFTWLFLTMPDTFLLWRAGG